MAYKRYWSRICDLIDKAREPTPPSWNDLTVSRQPRAAKDFHCLNPVTGPLQIGPVVKMWVTPCFLIWLKKRLGLFAVGLISVNASCRKLA